jgi:hypothetical protein
MLGRRCIDGFAISFLETVVVTGSGYFSKEPHGDRPFARLDLPTNPFFLGPI